MQNAILGIRTLNITQGNYSNYTHKGINALDLAGEDSGKDVWRAKNRWKCVNVLPYNTTGFANTCLFSPCDANGELVQVNTPSGIKSLTIALTHDNSIRVKVGGIYENDDFIYMEGITGNAQGNHIHAEACFSFVNSKVKLTGSQYWKGSTWVLPNAVPLHEALFLLKDYNIIKNDGGYDWQWVDSIESEDKPMVINEGENRVTYNGKKYIVVKQPSDCDVEIWSLKHPLLARLDLFNTNGKKPEFAQNLSLFQMGGANNGYVYGSEISDIYDEAVPTEQGFRDVVKLRNGEWKFGNFGYERYRKNEASLRWSCAMVLVAGGVYSNEVSEGVKASALKEPVIMSATFVDWSNNALMVVSEDAVTNDEMRNFAMALNMQYAFRNDSGGSSVICKQGVALNNYSGRALPNALVFVKKKTENTEPEIPDEPEVPIVKEKQFIGTIIIDGQQYEVKGTLNKVS